jgi:hypothetical protein
MSVATRVHQDRLQALRDRTQNARGARQRARESLQAAREAGDQDAQAVAELAFDQASNQLELAEGLQTRMLSMLSGTEGAHAMGGTIFEDPQVLDQLQRMGNGTFPIGAVDLGPVSTREELVQMINTGSSGQPKLAAAGDPVVVPDAGRQGAFYGIVPQPRRPLSILDLIPTQSMDGKSFEYLQETGTFGGAAETPEGAVKPEGDIGLVDAEAVARVIASWKKLSRPTVADVPELQAVVQNRLIYGVMRRLEEQVLAGNGVGENIKGILATAGIGDVAFDGAVPLSDLPLDGMVDVLMADAVPDAVAVNPVDWAAMLKDTDDTGARRDSGGAFATPATSLLGSAGGAQQGTLHGSGAGRIVRPGRHDLRAGGGQRAPLRQRSGRFHP